MFALDRHLVPVDVEAEPLRIIAQEVDPASGELFVEEDMDVLRTEQPLVECDQARIAEKVDIEARLLVGRGVGPDQIILGEEIAPRASGAARTDILGVGGDEDARLRADEEDDAGLGIGGLQLLGEDHGNHAADAAVVEVAAQAFLADEARFMLAEAERLAELRRVEVERVPVGKRGLDRIAADVAGRLEVRIEGLLEPGAGGLRIADMDDRHSGGHCAFSVWASPRLSWRASP